VQHPHYLGIETGAEHQQKMLAARTPQVKADDDSFIDSAANVAHLSPLPNESAKQVFSPHRYGQHGHGERHVVSHHRRGAISTHGNHCPQISRFMSFCREAGKLT
jgi:hypothetical protein